ncbi:MAG: rRNA pseudouridine synthase [Prevotellamassilia sp.]|nr:rRNA pseudouridine synthase [Prevotellamassilia sp.]
MNENFQKPEGDDREGYRASNEEKENGMTSSKSTAGRRRFSRNATPLMGRNYGSYRNENARFNNRNETYSENRGESTHYGARASYNDYESRGDRPSYRGKREFNRGGFQRNEGYGRRTYGTDYSGEGGYEKSERTFRNSGFRSQGSNGYQGSSNYQGHSGFSGGRPMRRPNAGFNKNRSFKKRYEYKEEDYDPTKPIRLNKFLANAGVCSRRDADKYIEAGVVKVNGEVVTGLGTKILRTDEIRFHDNPVKMEKKVYVLLNKPKGYVTTSEDPQNRKTVMDLVQHACRERIYPVGRLDRNTTGVLLLTNDGELATKLTHPKFLKKKIYHVTTDKNVTAADLAQIAEGITLEDGVIKADSVEYAHPTDKKQVGIEIHSGKNRIVRRIFESLGYHVVKLDRVFFAGLTKKNVKRGDWRHLTEKEVNMLRMGAYE